MKTQDFIKPLSVVIGLLFVFTLGCVEKASSQPNKKIFEMGSVDRYLTNYEDGKYTEDALELKEKLLWDNLKQVNKAKGYKYSIKENPKRKFIQKAKKKINSREIEILSVPHPFLIEIAFTNLAKVALEDIGIKAEIQTNRAVYESLAKGNGDFYMNAMISKHHAHHWEKFGDDLVKIGEVFSSRKGLVVPKYVNIESITQLNAHKEKFNSKIYGLGSTSNIYENTEKAIKEYNLNFKQVTSSGPVMMASLKKAYKQREPVIITGWQPHPIWTDYDLKYLDDPKGIFPKEVSAIVTRKGFEEDYPEVAEFLKNFNFKESALNSLYAAIGKSNNELKAAKKWYQDHKILVLSWMPESWNSQDETGKNDALPFDMVSVSGGTFEMGCTSEQSDCDDDETPVHTVTVNDFKISKYEITNQQFAEFMNAIEANSNGNYNGNKYLEIDNIGCQIDYFGGRFVPESGKENYPAIFVTWYGAKAFCEHYEGRLPTEAEWEFAARGGNSAAEPATEYAGSNNIDEVAWYMHNSDGPHEVGTKAPNELGIYDMSGNVWEWCNDTFGMDYYSYSPQDNPQGPSSPSRRYRVRRGGSWSGTSPCRVANRDGYYYNGGAYLGFRLCIVP